MAGFRKKLSHKTELQKAEMELSKSKDYDPKWPYFDDSKDKMDSYLSRFEMYATANKWIRVCGPHI